MLTKANLSHIWISLFCGRSILYHLVWSETRNILTQLRGVHFLKIMHLIGKIWCKVYWKRGCLMSRFRNVGKFSSPDFDGILPIKCTFFKKQIRLLATNLNRHFCLILTANEEHISHFHHCIKILLKSALMYKS